MDETNSEALSRLGFKLYDSESDLVSGSYSSSWIAPLTLGLSSTLEGTPNILMPNIMMDASQRKLDFITFQNQNRRIKIGLVY